MDNPFITPDEGLVKGVFFTMLIYISSVNTDMKSECLEIFCTARSVMQCIEQPYKVTAGSIEGKNQTTCIFNPN